MAAVSGERKTRFKTGGGKGRVGGSRRVRNGFTHFFLAHTHPTDSALLSSSPGAVLVYSLASQGERRVLDNPLAPPPLQHVQKRFFAASEKKAAVQSDIILTPIHDEFRNT